MIYYCVMPFFALLVLALQTTLLDLLFFGKITVEVALIMVIYAAFNFDILKGVALVLALGFLHDCMVGLLPGLFILSYLVIFIIAKTASYKIYSGRFTFIMGFVFLCTLLQGCLIYYLYAVLNGIEVSYSVFLNVFLPQALVVAVISPVFFVIFRRCEVFLNVREI